MPIGGQVFKGRHGQYSVTGLRPFAFGRASVIWLAVSETGDELIIKLFRETPKAGYRDALSDFQRETEARSQLSHQNILPILDWGTDSEGLESTPFLVLPFCRHRDLREAIRAQSFIPFERGIRILQQLAAAVDYAHSFGIVHGDIKPENVLFWRTPDHACLTDFGASKYVPHSIAVSAPGIAAGTPDYLSPEELNGRRATPASDLYSFALVAYEILTGVLPFDHTVALHSMNSRINGELENPVKKNPLLPGRVVPAFDSAFALDPARRPRSAASFVQSLLTEAVSVNSQTVVRTTADSPEQTSGVDRGSRFDPEQRIKLWTVIIGAIVAILTALITVFPSLITKRSSAPDAPPGAPANQSTPARNSSRTSR